MHGLLARGFPRNEQHTFIFDCFSCTNRFLFQTNKLYCLGNIVKIKAHAPDVGLGASTVLTCNIVGTSPSRFVSWTKASPSSSPLITSSSASTAKFTIVFSDSKTWIIKINEVEKSDEGTYYCNAESNGELVYDCVFIRVIGIHYFLTLASSSYSSLP